MTVEFVKITLLLLFFLSLELVHLLQLWDLECSVGLAGLHFQVVDLHVLLLYLVLSVKLLSEDNTRPVVKLLAEGSEVILAHGRDIGEGSNTFENSFRNTHLVVPM